MTDVGGGPNLKTGEPESVFKLSGELSATSPGKFTAGCLAIKPHTEERLFDFCANQCTVDQNFTSERWKFDCQMPCFVFLEMAYDNVPSSYFVKGWGDATGI